MFSSYRPCHSCMTDVQRVLLPTKRAHKTKMPSTRSKRYTVRGAFANPNGASSAQSRNKATSKQFVVGWSGVDDSGNKNEMASEQFPQIHHQ